jgi:hypothetical protein
MNTIDMLKSEAIDGPFADDDSHLHVYVYHGCSGKEKLGHVDFALGNTLLSYGCHDSDHRSPFYLFADGIFIQSNRLSFLKANFISGEMIIDYAVPLDSAQLKALTSRTDEICMHAEAWLSLNERGVKEIKSNDYASIMHIKTGCAFFRTPGVYSHYNAFNNNCVSMTADAVYGILPGYHALIHTPNSYFEFLEEIYAQLDSPIESRTVYFNSRK